MSDTKVSSDNDIPREANAVTRAFLEETLRSAKKRDDIVVKDFSVSRAIGKGDNYATVVLRVHVSCKIGNEVETQDQLIIKSMHDNDDVRAAMDKQNIFQKEVMAYKELFPTFIQYQIGKGLEPIRPSVPKFYHSVISAKEELLVLQDLCPDGYRMADKRKGLDYDHCKLVMKALANFHALSYAVKDGNPENLKEKFSLAFMESFYYLDSRGDMEPLLENSVKGAVDLVNEVVEDEEIKERTKMLSMAIFDTQLDFLKAEEPFSVLCHGDAWCNNMVFKYSTKTDDTPTDVKLLDFQLVRYALPTTDLAYFIYTSTTRSVRQGHLNDLLHLYHKTFLDTLNHVKVKISGFTFEVLENMFKKTMLFGVITACFGLPHMLGKAEDVSEVKADQSVEEVHKSMDEQRTRMIAGNKEAIKERLVGVIQDAIDAGVL